MQVSVEEINPVTRKLTIEIPADRVDAEIEKAYGSIQKKAKLQGFRPGKAPMALVKRTYADLMREQVARSLYEQTLYSALDEQKIEPVDHPTLETDQLEEGKPFKYAAVVEVMPQVQLNEYKGLAVQKEKYVFNPENVEGEIGRMRENMAQLIPLDEDTKVEKGHTVSLDYVYTVEGFPEESDKAENAQVEIGVNKLMPDLEEQILGMTAGETRQVRVTLPETYRNAEAAGKEGIFEITVKEIKRKELPELNDEFAQQFGEYDTMEELREKLTEYHRTHEQERIEGDLKEAVIKALVEKNPLVVPQSMVKRQLEHMLENLKNRLKSQRMSIEMMGLDEEGFRERFAGSAEDKVKGGLLLMALIEKENVQVEDADLEKRYETIAGGNADMLTRIRDYYGGNKQAKQSLIAEIKEDKAVAYLLENAVITEVEASEKAAA